MIPACPRRTLCTLLVLVEWAYTDHIYMITQKFRNYYGTLITVISWKLIYDELINHLLIWMVNRTILKIKIHLNSSIMLESVYQTIFLKYDIGFINAFSSNINLFHIFFCSRPRLNHGSSQLIATRLGLLDY